ncbi:hypothetical protein EYC55_21660 [Xanthomonas oryzae]|nr:hypothetical protein EYC55_21660 [Xanthomonas oryzae]QBG98439.1 hypothetical protein EYC56_01945 [Xanthomonas oryzae]
MGEVLRRLVARATVEQVSDSSTHLSSRQLAVLPHTSGCMSARSAVGLQQCVSASITRHQPEAP